MKKNPQKNNVPDVLMKLSDTLLKSCLREDHKIHVYIYCECALKKLLGLRSGRLFCLVANPEIKVKYRCY